MAKKNTSIINPLTLIAAGAGLLLLSRKVWQPRLNLDGQVVFITGGSRGLGLAMAEEFARRGARIAVCAKDAEELQRARLTIEETGSESVLTLVCDVSDREQVASAVQRVCNHFGSIDVLVNNAGIIAVGPVENQTLEDFEEAMNT